HRIDYPAFAQEWNRSADGKTRFYITTEVLTAYAKSWQKINNTRASQELISTQTELITKTREIFSASDHPFPCFVTSTSESVQPTKGLLDVSDASTVPPS